MVNDTGMCAVISVAAFPKEHDVSVVISAADCVPDD